METAEVFSFIKDFGFPVVLSWFLLVRMENKLANLTDVIGELSCNIAAMPGKLPKSEKRKLQRINCQYWQYCQ